MIYELSTAVVVVIGVRRGMCAGWMRQKMSEDRIVMCLGVVEGVTRRDRICVWMEIVTWRKRGV